MSGAIRNRISADSVIVAVNNRSANKFDYFLKGDVGYDLTLGDATSSDSTATLTIELTNTAPADGSPDIVLGNRGYSRLIVTTLTRLTPATVLVNGQPTPHVSRTEAGLNATDPSVDLAPGGSATVTIGLAGPIDTAGSHSLTTRTPLTTSVWSTTVDVRDQQGMIVAGTRQQQGFNTWSALR